MKELYVKYKLKAVQEWEAVCDYKIAGNINAHEQFQNLLIDVLELDKEPEEVLILITLNAESDVTGMFEVSRGLISETYFHPREIFKRALVMNAHGIMLAHNHPGGGRKPSSQDFNATRKICEAGEFFGIKVLEHMIIFDGGYYYSMNAENNLSLANPLDVEERRIKRC